MSIQSNNYYPPKNTYNIFPTREYKIANNHLFLDGGYADFCIKVDNGKVISVFDIKKNKQIAENLADIHFIDYQDLKKIDVNTDKSFPVRDIIDVSGKGPFHVKSETILANDIDYQNKKISVYRVLDPVGGSLQHLNDEIIFTPTPHFKGLMHFGYQVINSELEITQSAAKVYFRTPDLPKDPNFFDQWYLRTTNIPQLWKYYTGKNISVAVVDGGPLSDHPDIIANIQSAGNYKILPTNKDGFHGLGVSGVIAAQRNDLGLVGVSYDAKIAYYPFLGELNFIGSGQSNLDIRDIDLSLLKYYDVINNSWGSFATKSSMTKYLIDAYKNAANQGRNGLGSIIIFASGNNKNIDIALNQDVQSPYIIAVGGINKPQGEFFIDNTIDEFATSGSALLVSAPASHFPVLTSKNCQIKQLQFSCEHDIAKVEGTSFSAPIVSGITALMLEANPKLGWRDVQEILALTATKPSELPLITEDSENKQNTTSIIEPWKSNHAINWNGGGMHYWREYGFGVVDAEAAVNLAESWALQQNSKNYRKFSDLAPNLIIMPLVPGASLITKFVIKDSFIVESAVTDINLWLSSLRGLFIFLISPSNTTEKLFTAPPCINTEEEQIVKLVNSDKIHSFEKLETNNEDFPLSIISKGFLGEQSLGTWTLELFYASNCKKIIPDSNTHSFSLKLYGKDFYPKVAYYTNEFAHIANNSERTKVNPEFNINAAAVSGPVIIDLTTKSPSSILGKNIMISKDHKICSVISGAGDDTLIGNDQNNYFIAGRGTNSVHCGGGKDLIYFPNLAVHSGNTVIDDFSVKDSKLGFGRSITYKDMLPLITSSLDYSSFCPKITKFLDHCSSIDTIIKAENWSITLLGVNPQDLTENNFTFEYMVN